VARMRFEVSYQSGTTHEVDLPGRLCVVGRDPGCDIVLNDAKCSRRHAVVEDSSEGIVIRDSGSANGIYHNGKKVDRAALRPGDTVRMGDVSLRLLAEIGETVIVGPEGLDDAFAGPSQLGGDTGEKPVLAVPPAPLVPVDPDAPTPIVPSPAIPAQASGPPSPSRPGAAAARTPARPRAPSREPRTLRPAARPRRPATVSLLAGLWALFVPLAVAGALLAAARYAHGAVGWVAAGAGAVALAGLGTAMALGLRALAPWARYLQIATAAVGLLVCPFTLAAATVLLYMTRSEVKAAFDGHAPGAPAQESAEPTFALSLVGMLVLGAALVAIAVLVF
jgi:pSer/pThr/pTyr-binding forkhead associated (FHA) protein